MMKGRAMIILICLFAFLPVASAASEVGHVKLLAVSEIGDYYVGSLADLYLSIIPGEGRVFIDTYPLTKLDTQISTRFAKEIACSLLEMDCSEYDFIYTIEAETSIVGGPSAGAAIAGLTAAMLSGYEVNESVTVTGTINSGGLIGPVAGVKEKVEAAAGSGTLTLVFIPQGKRHITIDNESIDLVEYGNTLGVTVVEAAHLEDVVFGFTGEQVGREIGELVTDESYQMIMQGLADELCSETPELLSTISLPVVDSFNETPVYESMKNLTAQGEAAIESGDTYSAASFCFGANVKARYLSILSMRPSPPTLRRMILQAESRTGAADAQLKAREFSTITDLQTYLIVKERVDESTGYLREATESLQVHLSENSSEAKLNTIYALAFGIERLNSADSWSSFFDSPGKALTFDNSTMRQSCLDKTAEAQERLQYLMMVAPPAATLVRKEYDDALKEKVMGDFANCLFLASKSKARASLVLGVYGVEESNLNQLIENKVVAVERAVFIATEKGVFPLLGYSYLEYGKTLSEQDPSSALLYLELAQELSNFDMYFPPAKKRISFRAITLQEVLTFIIGLLLGLLISNGYWILKQKRQPRQKVYRKAAKVQTSKKKQKT